MKIYQGLLVIGCATLVSLIIANLPTGMDRGLGFMIPWFWPPVLGSLGAIIFLLLALITKRKIPRLFFCIAWTVYLVYVGVGLYVDKGWPLVY